MKLPRLFYKADLLILPVIVLCAFVIGLLPHRTKGTVAVIAVGGSTVAVIDLQQEQQALSVMGAEGFLFSVQNGSISVIQSPCDGKDCCHMPPIAAQGQWIFCLPMQLSVTVITEDQIPSATPDAVIG